jgi:predicted AlkP superfamily pyrophosphatase or phosphodiesterase
MKSLSFACILASCLFAAAAHAKPADPPRLVLQITVDQLRGDLLERYAAGLGKKGFRALQQSGVVFTNAHHRHANTETIVGHVTLATGADPAVHGMVANLWFDRQSGKPVYNVQDPEYPLLGPGGIDASSEIDPTQRAATTDGRSPRNILTSTIGDEIAMRFGESAKIFGVSIKDRGAIAMAGHAGQAYWFSKSEGRFVTSSFYRQSYPRWVQDWNSNGFVQSFAGTRWQLRDKLESYAFGTRDDQPWEKELAGFGRVFPHPYGSADNRYYTTLLTLSPAGDAITVDFAKHLIDAEQLGRDAVPDYLAVSLSSTDYVGHLFGPSSLEAEDNLRQLDDALADLLAHVDAQVGLDQTLVILSADHGAPENPAYLATLRIEADTFDFDRVDTEPGFARLLEAFGAGRELIASFSNPYLYLDRALMKERGLDPATVEARFAEELEKLPGIRLAISARALQSGAQRKGKLIDQVTANFHPERSGDIYVVFDPHWFVADFDGLTVASAHGSPWNYDTHVPVIIAGPGIRPQRIVRRVDTVDVAPTIAALLGTRMPSGTTGAPLTEVFKDR